MKSYTTTKEAFDKTGNVLSKYYHITFRSINIAQVMVSQAAYITLFPHYEKTIIVYYMITLFWYYIIVFISRKYTYNWTLT